MNGDLLARPCPVCDACYGEHTLDELAECMEDATGGADAGGLYLWAVPARPLETVTGPTLARVL